MLIQLTTDPSLACEHGILKAGAAQALLDVQQLHDQAQQRCADLLAQAQAQAEQVVADAQAQAETILQDAAERSAQAEAAGHAEGVRQAAQEWHVRHAELAQKAAQTESGLAERLAGVVTTAVERIVQAESRSALYQRALKHAQSLMRGASSLTLRVSPDDSEQARASIAELESASAMTVQVAVEPGLPPGACLFESELGVLDASLDLQLDAMRQAIGRATDAAVHAAAEEAPPAQAEGTLDLEVPPDPAGALDSDATFDPSAEL